MRFLSGERLVVGMVAGGRSDRLGTLAGEVDIVREAGGAAALRVVATRAALRPIQITGLDALIRLYETAEETLDD
jgi:hypothetical protein